MRKTIFLLFLCFLMSNFVFAQSSLAEFDKVRQIRLLQDNRENVRRILADYESDSSDDDDESDSDYFSTENAEINITYSTGDCSENDEFWNVKKSVVTKLVISPANSIKVKDFKFDFSNFTKEIQDEDLPEDYVYFNENSGIVFKVDDNEIWKIILFPSKGNNSLFCDNDTTKKISSNETRFIDSILEEKGCINPVANVSDILLDTTEITTECENYKEGTNCSAVIKEISVTTVAIDPDNDPLTYQYIVSGGKIVGQGAKVVWDLSGLERGSYTITAAVDDGCGFCGQTKTKTISVK